MLSNISNCTKIINDKQRAINHNVNSIKECLKKVFYEDFELERNYNEESVTYSIINGYGCSVVVEANDIYIFNSKGKMLDVLKPIHQRYLNLNSFNYIISEWYTLKQFSESNYNVNLMSSKQIMVFRDNNILTFETGSSDKQNKKFYDFEFIRYKNEHFENIILTSEIINLKLKDTSKINEMCELTINQLLDKFNNFTYKRSGSYKHITENCSGCISKYGAICIVTYTKEFTDLVMQILGDYPKVNDVHLLEKTLDEFDDVKIISRLIEKISPSQKPNFKDIIELIKYLNVCNKISKKEMKGSAFDMWNLYELTKHENAFSNCVKDVCNLVSKKAEEKRIAKVMSYKQQITASQILTDVANDPQLTSIFSDIKVLTQIEFMTKYADLQSNYCELVERLYSWNSDVTNTLLASFGI